MFRPAPRFASCNGFCLEQPRVDNVTPRWHISLPLLLSVLLYSGLDTPVHAQNLRSVFSDAIKTGTIVGAQIIEGSSTQPEKTSINLGFTSPSRRQHVTQDTMFCIASCSKPLISCVIFTLIETGKLQLDTPIDRWLPAYSKLKLTDGTSVAPPTLKQLLAHRGGIYSQKQNPTADQLQAIRNFRLTLSQSVNLIAQQPLQSIPGSRYAYSGAGYCLIGAIAQKAAQKPIDEILETQLCKPLGMSSTTFFPHLRTGKVVATGGNSRMNSPHRLGAELKLPLVGGSIHTTAQDLQRFARMIAERGTSSGIQLMRRETWSQYISLPFQTQRYGYGWARAVQGNEIVLSHNGSLPPAQAALQINLDTREYRIALWTLADPGNSQTTIGLRDQIRQALN